jgi:hypothetical protein
VHAGHVSRAATAGSQYCAEHEIRLLEEDPALGGLQVGAGRSGGQGDSEPDVTNTIEFAEMQAVLMRSSESTGEGGSRT